MVKPVNLKEVEQTSDHFTEMLEAIQNNNYQDGHLQGLRDCRWLFETWIAQLHKENKELKYGIDLADANKNKQYISLGSNNFPKGIVYWSIDENKWLLNIACWDIEFKGNRVHPFQCAEDKSKGEEE